MRGRYVYFPDHLVNLIAPKFIPGDVVGSLGRQVSFAWRALQEPLFRGALSSMWNIAMSDLRPAKAAPPELEDESIGAYFARRFGRPDLVNNVLSALVHGIYGGDVWKLSMENSMFRSLWLADRMPVPRKEGRTVLASRTDLDMYEDLMRKNPTLRAMAELSTPGSIIGFKPGFSSLTDAIAKSLQQNPRVTIKLNNRVGSIRYDRSSGKVKV